MSLSLITPLVDTGIKLEDVERMMIVVCLRRHNYNQSVTAKKLGLTRYQLRYRMKVAGLPRSLEADLAMYGAAI